MDSERPGREIPKEYREVVVHLIDTQGWRYETGSGHPKLYPPVKAMGFVTMSGTPGDRRGFNNFLTRVRKAGGVWPPGREPKDD